MSNRGDRTSDYEYSLPAARIAQHPVSPRDASRLMVVHRETGELAHRFFRDLPTLMSAGDALVVNTSRVVRARFIGQGIQAPPLRCSCCAVWASR